MRYIRQHIQTIIGEYNGALPLSHFLKNYYKQYPVLGSRDRRLLSDMAYAWYRCSKAISHHNLSFQDAVNVCIFLCGSRPQLITKYLPDAWEPAVAASLGHKLELLKEHGIDIHIHQLFPYSLQLSHHVLADDWLLNMLEQPELFVRIVKNETALLKILDEQGIAYKQIAKACYALPNTTTVDKLWPADSYWVQDASSQQTGSYFKPLKNEHWLDCCSGAGGKSLLLKSLQPSVELWVSDVRKSILHNLQKRFQLYGFPTPQMWTVDWTNAQSIKAQVAHTKFDAIICDVPCTGSGTWARTPEEMYFFDVAKLASITQIQLAISTNAASALKPGAKMVYITCSVFKQENEDVVQQLMANTGLVLQEINCINGIPLHADCMFVAVLKKPQA